MVHLHVWSSECTELVCCPQTHHRQIFSYFGEFSNFISVNSLQHFLFPPVLAEQRGAAWTQRVSSKILVDAGISLVSVAVCPVGGNVPPDHERKYFPSPLQNR